MEITRVPGVSTSFFVPDVANHVPHMAITWDAARMALTPAAVSQMLKDSNPSIAMSPGEERPGLAMNSFMLQPGENRIVAEKLARIFREHSREHSVDGKTGGK
jgi:L-seryl-tRNA(Ser) seleniumtransferase